MKDELSARFDLLDNQLVDSDRLPIGRIDDLEFAFPDAGPAYVEALLTGAEALGQRIDGPIGRAMTAISALLRPRDAPSGPTRVEPDLIEEIDPLVRLKVRFSDLPHVAGLERWLARHVVEKLPGAGDVAE